MGCLIAFLHLKQTWVFGWERCLTVVWPELRTNGTGAATGQLQLCSCGQWMKWDWVMEYFDVQLQIHFKWAINIWCCPDGDLGVISSHWMYSLYYELWPCVLAPSVTNWSGCFFTSAEVSKFTHGLWVANQNLLSRILLVLAMSNMLSSVYRLCMCCCVGQYCARIYITLLKVVLFCAVSRLAHD